MAAQKDALTELTVMPDSTRLWHYRSSDVLTPDGYFNPLADILTAGDMILANLGGLQRVGIFLITANADGMVSFDDLSHTESSVAA